PALPPIAIAAAPAIARIDASSVAVTVTAPPGVIVEPSIVASTEPAMPFTAAEPAPAMPTPAASPPTPTAPEIPITKTWIDACDSAVTETPAPELTSGVPVIAASTCVVIWLKATVPEPATPIPTSPLPASAALIAPAKARTVEGAAAGTASPPAPAGRKARSQRGGP